MSLMSHPLFTQKCGMSQSQVMESTNQYVSDELRSLSRRGGGYRSRYGGGGHGGHGGPRKGMGICSGTVGKVRNSNVEKPLPFGVFVRD